MEDRGRIFSDDYLSKDNFLSLKIHLKVVVKIYITWDRGKNFNDKFSKVDTVQKEVCGL